MMQAADFWSHDNRAHLGPLDGSHVGRVLLEREMSSRAVIVDEVAGQDAAQVPLAEHKDMVQTLTANRADEPLREGVLPRAVGRRQDLVDPHALHSLSERMSVDLIAIAEEVGRGGVVREGVHDLLGRPGGGGMLGDVEVEDAPALVGEHNEDEEHPQASSRDREEIDGDQIPDVIGQERSPALRGRRAPLGSRRETVRSATSMPCFRSSPWILGAPHRGFATAICVTRALICALTGGRPTAGRPESLVQYSRKRCRCHRRTVSAVTMTRGCLHPAQTLASPTQKNRSAARSLGRVIVLLYTASCWCKARFSRASWRWPPQRNGKRRSRWSSRVIIEL